MSTPSPKKRPAGKTDNTNKLNHELDVNQIELDRRRVEQELRQSEERYRRLFEAAQDGILVLDADSGQIDDVNPFIQDMIGYTHQELLNKKLWEIGLFKNIVASKEAFLELQNKGYVRFENMPLETKDGRHIAVEFVSNVYLVNNKKVIQCNIRDITSRVLAEEQLKQVRQELERSNKDLGIFAFVASHDLREPLRSITGFMELIEKRYKDKFDQSGKDFVNFVVSGTKRMDSLLTALLEYSRIQVGSKSKTSFSVNTVLDDVFANLDAVIKETNAEITFDQLPIVIADKDQLIQLFQNLIQNAIKFRGKQRPKIHIGCRKEENLNLFSVQDNGIGINPQYSDRIFAIFQRLHTQDEYSGSGIGLAICKRIVEQHGGKIWVESQESKGSTFFFTIPD
jgi:PAS domain S-box-containing protein